MGKTSPLPRLISIRLDAGTQRLIEVVARRTRRSRSAVVRDALATALRSQLDVSAPGRPFDDLAPFIGTVRGGPKDLSTRTGDHFRRLLTERTRRRA